MRAPDWLLLLLLLPPSGSAHLPDICEAKPRELPLEPRCLYRGPAPSPAPTPGVEPPPGSTNPRVWELSQANSRFALRLLGHVTSSRSPLANVLLAPLSVSASFAMTRPAACGRTLQQLMEVFQFDSAHHKTSDQLGFFFAKLNCRLFRKTGGGATLVSAHRLFGDASLSFNSSYQNISSLLYGAQLQPLPFKEDPEGALQAINSWISSQTQDLVQDTLPPGALDSNAALVVVSSLYFKGQWKNRFDPENVYQSDFQLSERRRCSVPTMFQEGRFRYASYPQDQVQVLELPYQGDRLSMVLVLPGPSTTLAQVEEGLHLARLDQWLSSLQESTVALHLPRFKMQDALSLKGALQSMGLTDLFNPDQASLPGMIDGDDRIHVSDAFHKVFLEVTEEGSEAAAATAVVTSGRSINLEREVMEVNRPFLLFIRESSINALLFIARVANPC